MGLYCLSSSAPTLFWIRTREVEFKALGMNGELKKFIIEFDSSFPKILHVALKNYAIIPSGSRVLLEGM